MHTGHLRHLLLIFLPWISSLDGMPVAGTDAGSMMGYAVNRFDSVNAYIIKKVFKSQRHIYCRIFGIQGPGISGTSANARRNDNRRSSHNETAKVRVRLLRLYLMQGIKLTTIRIIEYRIKISVYSILVKCDLFLLILLSTLPGS